MFRMHLLVASGVVCALAAQAFGQSWVNFSNQTSTRLIAAPGLGTTDPEEKDFAFADFDQDGDIDLVNVRKQPFTTAGRKPNVLFMNEGIADGHAINGVLVDRTALYASEADDGGQGMLDLTADRDVQVVDVNNDGWIDIVTAPTYGSGLAKSISHPRIYINQGESGGVWQGFKYEQARIPNFGSAPNFCGVGAGDVNGDKAPDLYFIDYDSVTTSPFDDRLLINDGTGFFTDQSVTRMTAAMLESSFGTSAHIADMNGDGWLDVVKSENGPISTRYNGGNGFFNALQATYSGAAYHSSIGDLNADGKLDIVASDDGIDRYLLNIGNAANGQTQFTNLSFPASSSGFGATARFHDMNNDGHVDVFVCDVDVDAPGCSRVTKIFRNLGNYPNPTFTDPGSGSLSVAERTGVHDMAVIDLDNDGWKDLIVARCTGIKVWMQTPPSGLQFNYPTGLPQLIPAGKTYDFEVQLSAIGGTPDANSAKLHYAINGGSFTTVNLPTQGGNLYQASLPSVECTDVVTYYVSGTMNNGATTFTDPSGAPGNTYETVAADGTQVTLDDPLEGSVAGWTVNNDAGYLAGAWQQADPNGTVNASAIAAPEDDAGNGTDIKAFVTENGAAGAAANVNDVDGGATRLTSPVIDLDNSDATISYIRWFYCEDAGFPEGDFLRTEVSNNNGATWVLVHQTGSTNGTWELTDFRVGEFVTPSSQVRVRFSTSDAPNNSITEAGIDNFHVDEVICGVTPCPGDVDGTGAVDVDDLLVLIGQWGQPGAGNPADLNADGSVNIDDLLILIGAWGNCP